MIGGFLQASGRVGQEMAQFFPVRESFLAGRESCCNLDAVVVAQPSRAKTGSLFRYPSPAGRCAFPLGAPPIFLTARSMRWPGRRSLAHFGIIGRAPSYALNVVSSSGAGTKFNLEGYTQCKSRNGSPVRYALSHLQLVATRRLNRASSARVQVQAQRSCWTATLSAARLLVARQTCFTARAIPAAANAKAIADFRPHEINRHADNHRAFMGAGGFFMSEDLSSAGQHAPCQAPEGT
jgi:hypothetical protein